MKRNQPSSHQGNLLSGFCALMLTAAVAGFASGCGSDDDEKQPPITLSVSDNNMLGTPPALAIDYWAERLSKQAGGRLKLNVSHEGTLLTMSQAYKGVQSRAADVALYVLDRGDGFDLNVVIALPFLSWPNQRKTAQTYTDLLATYPALRDEWKGVKIVGMIMMQGTHLHNMAKDIRTPSDLSGMKTMGAESLTVEAVRAAGAIPAELDVTQMTAGLANGSIEAIINHFSVLAGFGALDMLTHHTLFGEGGINMTPMFLIMNNDSFASLPSDLQTMVANSGPYFQEKLYELDGGFGAASMGQAQAANHSFIQLTPEEIAVWYNMVKQPVHDTWIAAGQAAGLPTQALYQDVLQRIQAAAASR